MINNSDYERASAFKTFHLANPHVYEMLYQSANRLRSARRVSKWGIRNLWEKLRWDLAVQTDRSDEDYKLNDHHAPYYARMLVRDFPEKFDGWLEVRGARCQLPDGV